MTASSAREMSTGTGQVKAEKKIHYLRNHEWPMTAMSDDEWLNHDVEEPKWIQNQDEVTFQKSQSSYAQQGRCFNEARMRSGHAVGSGRRKV